MKTKIIIGFSTNRSDIELEGFKRNIKKTIGCDYHLIKMINHGSQSLTSIYNEVWNTFIPFNECFENTIFVFCHHDIHFKTNGWGKCLLNLYNNNDIDIIGVAGTSKLNSHCVWWLDEEGKFSGKDLFGKVWHTDGKKEWKSDFTTVNKKCNKLQPVVAIDGLFIAVNPSTCEKFDEDFSGFHYYDISFCVKNILKGKKIAVTETIQICHDSGGNPDEKWEESRIKLYNKYETSTRWPIGV